MFFNPKNKQNTDDYFSSSLTNLNNNNSKKKTISNTPVSNYNFILFNLNLIEIDKKYKLIELCQNDFTENNNLETTSLDTIGINNLQKQPLITVIPREKLKQIIYPLLIEYNGKSLPETWEFPCAYCRRKFKNVPIGIPIRFENEKFITDTVVCSFNCIKSFIREHSSPLYNNTSYLTDLLYFKIFGDYPPEKIKESLSWRTRQEYGGGITDEEYEKNLQIISSSDLHQLFLFYPRLLELNEN
jgi:hypothetical protein